MRAGVLFSLLVWAWVAVGVRYARADSAAQPAVASQVCAVASGTISSASGANSSVTATCPGASSYLVSLVPTSGSPFVGTLTGTGSVLGDGTTANGGRLIFKSGVGSLGSNSVVMIGSPNSVEYRFIGGGTTFTLAASAYTSGSVAVTIMGQYSTPITFVNGPVHSAEEEAVRAGRGFLASTGLQSASTGQVLNFSIVNPLGSGMNVFVVIRQYSNTSANVLTVVGRNNPGAISGGTAVTPANRRPDSSQTSVCTFYYQLTTTALSTGTVAGSGAINPSGISPVNVSTRMLTPGTSIGGSIGGSGGGLFLASAGVIYDIVWFEEPQN